MDAKQLGLIVIVGIAALGFLLMPKKPVEAIGLTTNKAAYSTGSNGKYEIEANGSVMAAAVGLKSTAPTAPPKPTPTPTPPTPRKPILPWRHDQGPVNQPTQPEAAVIDLEALKPVVKPQAGGCANGQCYQPRRIFRR